MITQLLILLLFIDAAYIACGLMQKRDMWSYICIYWILLTVKNLVDLL